MKKLESQSMSDNEKDKNFNVEDIRCSTPDQLEFFYANEDDELKRRIRAINLDIISPKNALDILYELKELV